MSPDSSEEVCLSCNVDKTAFDNGVGFGQYLFKKDQAEGLCCGNQEKEYYLIDETNMQRACCSSGNACVDSLGNCISSNTPKIEGHEWHCSINKWYECDEKEHVLCSEAGANYNKKIEYSQNRETGWYCAFSNGWAWRNKMSEDCFDGIDNNCDKRIDMNDTECIQKYNSSFRK